MESKYKDISQVAKVATVADTDHVFVDVAGSLVRVRVADLLTRLVGDDSAGLLETLRKFQDAVNSGDNVGAIALLEGKIAANTTAIETLAAKDGQFTVERNYVDVATGRFVGSDNWISTPILSLNKAYDLILHIAVAGNGGIAFYDAAKQCISGLGGTVIGTGQQDYTVQKSDFPSNAMYFAASTMRIDAPSWSNGPTREAREGAAADAIAASKLALFVDEWKSAWGSYGGYDPTKEKPFLGNGLEMSYDEAIVVMQGYLPAMSPNVDDIRTQGRTNAPIPGATSFSCSNSFHGGLLELVNLFGKSVSGFSACFYNSPKLKTITNLNMRMCARADYDSFSNLPALEVLDMTGLKISLDLSSSPLINLASWQKIVSTAINTAEITITVHPDVYAKLTDTANTEWHKVLTDAAAKKISFATTASE